MKHQQVLDKLAAPGHVRALDEELARWVGRQMLGPPKSPAELALAVIPPILARWRCLLDADDVASATKQVVRVALATLLHKYGLADALVTSEALAAVDELNHGVVLSDAFARQTPAVKELLTSAPLPLTRRPRQLKAVTFLRPGDVLSVQLGAGFHAVYVRQVHGANEYPIIEFYAGRFDRPPGAAELSGRAAARDRGRARYAVIGLTYLPDPAGQFVAVAAPHPEPPVGEEPRPGEGLYTMSELIDLQRHLPAG